MLLVVILLPVPLLSRFQYYVLKNRHLHINFFSEEKFKKSKSDLEPFPQAILVSLGNLFLGAKSFCQLPVGVPVIDQYPVQLASTDLLHMKVSCPISYSLCSFASFQSANVIIKYVTNMSL